MITERAYAKINIGLHLLRRRPDGYRDIETVFHRVDLWDELTIEEAPSLSLRSSDPSIPSDDTNLCMKAAALLRAHCGTSAGAAMTLTKRIPAGAGLGGGSADAAAALRGLAALWRAPLPEAELAALALSVGSDVPFFLGRGSAFGQGRGEILEYFNLDLPYWIVLATPDVHISTAWAYEQTVIPARPAGPPVKQIVTEHLRDARRYMTLLRNDFEPLVLRTHPEVASVKQALYLHGAEFAQMSGSGSSVYGLFREEASARASARALPSCRVSLTAPGFQPA
jgi:4-diphosphocytidyl-2-C-methyl-D-erythritol kinase